MCDRYSTLLELAYLLSQTLSCGVGGDVITDVKVSIFWPVTDVCFACLCESAESLGRCTERNTPKTSVIIVLCTEFRYMI